MQFKLDKTAVLVAATKALQSGTLEGGDYDVETVQGIVDLLSGKSAKYIQSVLLSEWEYELISDFLEDV